MGANIYVKLLTMISNNLLGLNFELNNSFFLRELNNCCNIGCLFILIILFLSSLNNRIK